LNARLARRVRLHPSIRAKVSVVEKIWLKSYAPEVPAQVDVRQFDSLPAMLESVCTRFAALPAFTNQGAVITYRELDALSRQLAAYLQHGAGLAKGERVALMMPNLLQSPVAFFGVLRAGCVVVNTNPLYTARELRHQLADSGATCIIVLENFAHTLQEVLADTAVRTVITTRVGDLLHFPRAQITNFVVKHVKHMVPDWHIAGALALPDVLARGADLSLDPVPWCADDLALLQYTGGTTGVPKAAMLTHGNMVANVLQTVAWVAGVLEDGAETAIIPLPLYHVFALIGMLTFLKLGANNVLITNPRDMKGFVKALKHTKFSAIIGVNTLFKALLNAPDIGQANTSGLKVAIAGGMAVQRAVAAKWQEVFGVPIIEGYGLTETSPIACANPLNIREYTGMIGLPVPSTDVAILDDGGQPMALGALGEICIRGPQVMKGYWNKPEETANVFTADGWLRTGDMGVMDARGFVKLLDRKKDVIVVSGFKVFPNEVEDVAAMHPGVLEVVAIAAADERSEHVVKIVVVKKDPALTAEALIAHCKHFLTGYKVPKYVVFRDSPLPKSNIGKILRRVVKDEENGLVARAESPSAEPAAQPAP
jgi:long-chain acyl-CoA synthetase